MLSIYKNRPQPLEWIAFAVIMILAIALRFGAPGIVEFKRDEANLSYLALDMARGVDFPLLGIDSSVGIPNAPVNVYLMALPYLFTSDPVIATQFVGLLNVIAVALAYWLTRRYYGPLAAITAGLLFAVSPWSVIYSRKIWAQDMLPVFVVMTVGTGLIGFLEGKRWAQWLHLPLLAITGQLHYGAFVLIPITLYLLIVGRKRLTRTFLWSLVVTGLVIIPYVIGAARASLLSPNAVTKILSAREGSTSIQLTGDALSYAAFTVSGSNLHSVAGAEAFQQYLGTVPNAYPLFDALAWAILIAAIWLVIRAVRYRDARTPVDITLLIWLIFTPLAFSVTWTPVYPHYMIPMIPAAYMVLGAAIGDLRQRLSFNPDLRRATFALVSAGIAAVVVFQLWLQIALHFFVYSVPTPGGFGTPLSYFMPIREAILAQHPKALLANLDGQYIGYHDETTVWNFLLYDVPSRRFLDENTEVYPAEEALYLSHRCGNAQPIFYLRARQEGCFTFDTRLPGDFEKLNFTPVENADKSIFANGARVIAYQWQPDPGCLSVAWTVKEQRPEDFSFAVHFIDADGKEVMGADGLSWRGRYWRAGDTIVRKYCIQNSQERIPEIAGVQLGMYTYEDKPEGRVFHNLDVLDTNSTPVGQSLEIRFEGES